jgi:hypothetical protein
MFYLFFIYIYFTMTKYVFCLSLLLHFYLHHCIRFFECYTIFGFYVNSSNPKSKLHKMRFDLDLSFGSMKKNINWELLYPICGALVMLMLRNVCRKSAPTISQFRNIFFLIQGTFLRRSDSGWV